MWVGPFVIWPSFYKGLQLSSNSSIKHLDYREIMCYCFRCWIACLLVIFGLISTNKDYNINDSSTHLDCEEMGCTAY